MTKDDANKIRDYIGFARVTLMDAINTLYAPDAVPMQDTVEYEIDTHLTEAMAHLRSAYGLTRQFMQKGDQDAG